MQPKMVATESFKADPSSIVDLRLFHHPALHGVDGSSVTRVTLWRSAACPPRPQTRTQNARAVLRAVSLKSRARSHKGVAPRAVRLGAVVCSRLDARRF